MWKNEEKLFFFFLNATVIVCFDKATVIVLNKLLLKGSCNIQLYFLLFLTAKKDFLI
jgi:hypothetical protein